MGEPEWVFRDAKPKLGLNRKKFWLRLFSSGPTQSRIGAKVGDNPMHI